MYIPTAFREETLGPLHEMIQATGLAIVASATAQGVVSTPLPLVLVPEEGPYGTLYGHMARANPHWRETLLGDGTALFLGPSAYISPSWYPSKQEHHRVAPTWNYVAVEARGPLEFFDEAGRLRQLLSRLTARHEAGLPRPWAVEDAPEDYLAEMLKGIVGLRLPIAHLDGKWKMSQNRTPPDRAGAAAGLQVQGTPAAAAVASLIPE